MDIRTKLALALVSVSLLSMFLLGAFAYQVSSDLLQEISERQLDALAEAKKQDLEQIVESWRTHVRLIRSRTQLRIRLQEYQQSEEQNVLVEMRRIAEDAQKSTEHVQRITLFDRNGNEVISAGNAPRSPVATVTAEETDIWYSGFYLGDDGQPRIVFNSTLSLDAEVIGSIEVIIGVTTLQNLAGNYRGLGETGETMIFGQNPDGSAVLLHTLRHAGQLVSWDDPPEYVRAAVAGQDQVFTEDIQDYRGKRVWAATRYLSNVDWGLVVKVDAEEEGGRALGLREDLIDLGLALGAFAVAGGTLLGIFLARPIRELEQVVRRVQQGESSLRANARLDDEIGLLAEALNEYLDDVNKKKEKKRKKKEKRKKEKKEKTAKKKAQ
ncbi:MAG: HAMP domain-containing protein [Gammaproteobacteria bacterium]|nr:HAMP domain-containing protein [Gammaproteobacteria bacterium]